MNITAEYITNKIEKALYTEIAPAGCRHETIILNAACALSKALALLDILSEIDMDAFAEVYTRTEPRRLELLDIEERLYHKTA